VADATLGPLGHGLINRTFLVEATTGHRYVLQALNPIFPPRINEDIDRVTGHLADRGLQTPRLVRTLDGAAWVESAGEVWRMLTWVPGVSLQALQNSRQARAAGALLARFHDALSDYHHPFSNPRLGVHDTARHLAVLRGALDTHREHRDYGAIRPVAEQILEAADSLPRLPELPDRTVHGDPKIDNLRFDAEARDVVCLVDLDTLGRMPLPLELGDALRSWCNPVGENAAETRFSATLFGAALGGYAQAAGRWLTEAEWRAFVPAIGVIQVELAARFCADALNEKYFAWDPECYASRSQHNMVRARGQLATYRECVAQHERLAELAAAAFSG
jgi:Ser/Thr protein kinase RdoA (MazF antagonist)